MEGKTVEVIVTFNEAVEVKTNGGTPTIGINLDQSRTRQAPYVRGSDSHEIVFAYTIANGDGNTNRIEVNRNSMKRNGAEVHSAETKVEALLDHDGTVVQGTPGSTAQGPSARFERVPEHHEGTQFNIELHFNTEIPGLSGQTVQGALLDVEGRLGKCSRTTDTGKQPGMARQRDTIAQRENRDPPSGARMRRAKRCVRRQPAAHRSGIGNRAGRSVDGAVPQRAPRA